MTSRWAVDHPGGRVRGATAEERRSGARRRVRPLVLALPLLFAGCRSATVPPVAPDLSATVEQSRDNEDRRLLQLVLRNAGPTPIRVVGAQLSSPGYRTVAARAFDDEIAPGSQIAFPVPYGEPVCDVAGPAPSDVVATLAGGVEARVRVPDGDPLLPRLHRRDCALQRVRAAVQVELTALVRSGDAARGRLRLTRRSGSAPVALTQPRNSIIFALRAVGPLPLVLGAAERQASTPVELNAARCDPHALIESKRTFTFAVYVSVGDEPPVQVGVTPEAEGRALLQAVLTETCG